MLAGVAIGALAVQALHAQAKPKTYYVVEIGVLDAAANAAYGPKVQAAQSALAATTETFDFVFAAARRARSLR